ncbi:hypothetical protein O9993_04785 [Vibrio lentus]|nr:hypothetical protein [Vibrio lentus]
MGWSKQVTDVAELAGVESALAAAPSRAEAKSGGRRLPTDLDDPSYLPVMTYCDN